MLSSAAVAVESGVGGVALLAAGAFVQTVALHRRYYFFSVFGEAAEMEAVVISAVKYDSGLFCVFGEQAAKSTPLISLLCG